MYKLMKGEFHIFYPDLPKNGPEPDGDTLKFKPDNPSFAEAVWRPGVPKPDFNGREMVNLRFEGLDALETHFAGAHQNLKWAEGSRDFLLRTAGFGAVTFWPDRPNKVQTVETTPVRGYVLSNGLDGHGRIVAFVFFGEAPEPDGAEFRLTEERMATSFNAQSLAAGFSYPLFYLSLPKPLQVALAQISEQARSAGTGLFADNNSSVGTVFTVTPQNLGDLVIWPKLFRRLVSYFASEFLDLTGFDTWLRADTVDRDDRVLIPSDYDAHFHNVVEVISATAMRMTVEPADIVVLPDDYVMPDTSLHGH